MSLHFASTPTPPAKNSYIVVSGVTPAGYNGTYQVTNSYSTYVTYSVSSCPGTYSSGGTLISAGYTSYYPNGNQDMSVDGAGSQTYTTYYPSDAQYTVTTGYGSSNPATETYTYDADGNTLTDQSGTNTTTNTYNDVDWSLTSTDQLGNKTTYAYDSDGNVTTETDPGTSMAVTGGSWSGNVATLDFATNTLPSVQGQIVVSGVSPSNYNGTFTVTASGVVNGTTDYVQYALSGSGIGSASGGTIQVPAVTHNTYDGANRLQSTCVDGIPTGSLCGGTPASNPQVSNTYDNDGNVVTANDAGSGDTSGQSKNPWQQSNMTEVGGQDQAKTATPPDGSTYATNTTYTATGQVSTITNANGDTKTYTYDSSDRVTGISYSDGTHSVTYSYNTDDTVSQMTDGTGTTYYTYDGQGNLATESHGSPGQDEMQYTMGPGRESDRHHLSRREYCELCLQRAGSDVLGHRLAQPHHKLQVRYCWQPI